MIDCGLGMRLSECGPVGWGEVVGSGGPRARDAGIY
jgi:hypothetical protein